MLDNRLMPALLARQVEILDPVALGQIVADWATGARPLPRTPRALRQALAGAARVSPRVRDVQFTETRSDRLTIRLPDPSLVEAASDALTDPWVGATFPFPRFYAEAVDPELGAMLSPVDLMHARVADHALGQCL